MLADTWPGQLELALSNESIARLLAASLAADPR